MPEVRGRKCQYSKEFVKLGGRLSAFEDAL
jgi:hypothetical protein